MSIKIQKIERLIYVIRGQNVMLDSDLADLYDIETRVFNQAVKRNVDRFPKDFMFELNESETTDLCTHLGTKGKHGGRRKNPLVFTENGVAMLSSILNSKTAIQINISIMRTFTKLRSYLSMESDTSKKLNELEKGTNNLFKVVFQRLDEIEESLNPAHVTTKRKIGFISSKT